MLASMDLQQQISTKTRPTPPATIFKLISTRRRGWFVLANMDLQQ